MEPGSTQPKSTELLVGVALAGLVTLLP